MSDDWAPSGAYGALLPARQAGLSFCTMGLRRALKVPEGEPRKPTLIPGANVVPFTSASRRAGVGTFMEKIFNSLFFIVFFKSGVVRNSSFVPAPRAGVRCGGPAHQAGLLWCQFEGAGVPSTRGRTPAPYTHSLPAICTYTHSLPAICTYTHSAPCDLHVHPLSPCDPAKVHPLSPCDLHVHPLSPCDLQVLVARQRLERAFGAAWRWG